MATIQKYHGDSTPQPPRSNGGKHQMTLITAEKLHVFKLAYAFHMAKPEQSDAEKAWLTWAAGRINELEREEA